MQIKIDGHLFERNGLLIADNALSIAKKRNAIIECAENDNLEMLEILLMSTPATGQWTTMNCFLKALKVGHYRIAERIMRGVEPFKLEFKLEHGLDVVKHGNTTEWIRFFIEQLQASREEMLPAILSGFSQLNIDDVDFVIGTERISSIGQLEREVYEIIKRDPKRNNMSDFLGNQMNYGTLRILQWMWRDDENKAENVVAYASAVARLNEAEFFHHVVLAAPLSDVMCRKNCGH